MLETIDLTKAFREREVVSKLNLKVGSGEVVGLLGPNGAGKTTTMRMLTTFLRPSFGTAVVAGYDVLKSPAEVRRHIGYLPENPPLYPELTVVEYLTFIGKIRGVYGSALRARLAELIERCSLGEVRKTICSVLSKGFKQRVGLAQALIHRPQVLILDEPTSGLDPRQIIEIRALMTELKQSHTVILSTHILPEVEESCSRAVIIVDGRIVSDEPLDRSGSGSLEQRFLSAVAQERNSERQAGAGEF